MSIMYVYALLQTQINCIHLFVVAENVCADGTLFLVCVFKGGATALYIAVVKGHVPVVQLLLDKGAAIEAKISVRYRYRRRPDLI